MAKNRIQGARRGGGCDLFRVGNVWYISVIIQYLMNTIAIDTHKTVKRLLEKGYTEEQAEGFVEALTESELVSKADLNSAIKDLKLWVALMLLAQAGVITALIKLIG